MHANLRAPPLIANLRAVAAKNHCPGNNRKQPKQRGERAQRQPNAFMAPALVREGKGNEFEMDIECGEGKERGNFGYKSNRLPR